MRHVPPSSPSSRAGRRHAAALSLAVLIAMTARPATGAGAEPHVVGARLAFPEGAAIPRHATPTEIRWLADRSPLGPKAEPTSPTGPLHCVAEYEPMDGIVVGWEGPTSWKSILAQMGALITTLGEARFYVSVDTPAERATADADLRTAGADMTRVQFVLTDTDTIWMRDYGPRYVYEGDCRAIVDHVYNRPRPADDDFPVTFANVKGHARYDLSLVHGGGNYHLDALGSGFATRLINAENPNLSELQVHGLWREYQDLDTTFLEPLPRAVDSTQHLDMWMVVVADDAVVISDWPFDRGTTQDRICNETAAALEARGYTVHRVPARSVQGTHYTYTNMVLVNGLAIVPSYSHPEVARHDAEARAAWEAAVPDRTVVQVPCQDIVTASGVMHCIVMHVPAHLGGEAPTAYLRSPRGCEVLVPGETVEVQWITDDDEGVVEVDLELSLNDGQTYPLPVALGQARNGTYAWTVPDLDSASARLRVVARDAEGNVGLGEGDGSFRIGKPSDAVALETPLLVSRDDVSVFLSVPESDEADGYNVYEGAIGQFATIQLVGCSHAEGEPGFERGGGRVSMTEPMPAGDRWYLVTASNCLGESSLGRSPAGPRCGP